MAASTESAQNEMTTNRRDAKTQQQSPLKALGPLAHGMARPTQRRGQSPGIHASQSEWTARVARGAFPRLVSTSLNPTGFCLQQSLLSLGLSTQPLSTDLGLVF